MKWQCRYCERWTEPKALVYDHFIPRIHGGLKLGYANKVLACYLCNFIKGSLRFKTMEESRTYIMSRRAFYHENDTGIPGIVSEVRTA